VDEPWFRAKRVAPSSAISFLLVWAKDSFHGSHQFDDPGIGYLIEDEIGVLPEADDILIPQDGEMLRDIGIGSFHFISEFANSHLFVLQEAEDFQAERMGHGLQQARNFVYIVVVHGFII
jgi:hypothetical protein